MYNYDQQANIIFFLSYFSVLISTPGLGHYITTSQDPAMSHSTART